MTEEKVRENRLRRMARRQGLELRKNPRRDPRATDYGSYMIVDPYNNAIVADFGWDRVAYGDHLAEAEEWLESNRPDAPVTHDAEGSAHP